MNYYQRKKLRHFWSKFKWPICVYFAFILLFICMWSWPFAFKKMTSWLFGNNDFFDAWFPTLFEDILFFGTAFVCLLVGTKLLRNESFEVRISSLANGRFVNAQVDLQLRKEIQRLLAFNNKFTMKASVIKIAQHSNAQPYVFVRVRMKCTVVNMCHIDKLPTYVSTYVEPGEKVNKTYGTIYYHKIKHQTARNKHHCPKVIRTHIIKNGRTVDLNTLAGKRYTYRHDYLLEGDGKAKWELEFGVWVPFGHDVKNDDNWLFNLFSGYTENFTFILCNKLTQTINFDLRYHTHSGRTAGMLTQKSLQAGKKLSVVSGLSFNKDEKFEIYFH